MDLSRTLEENKISTGRRRGGVFLRGAWGLQGGGHRQRAGSAPREQETQAVGQAGEREMRDAGERRAGVRLERALRNYLEVKGLILCLVGKWKPMEDLEQRARMVRHMLREDQFNVSRDRC